MSSSTFSELDLINIIVCLTLKDGKYNLFYKKGYRLQSIEHSVETNAGTVKYDVFLSNKEKDKGLGFELKGGRAGNLDKGQATKYQEINEDFILNAGIDVTNIKDFELQSVYGVNDSYSDRVKNFFEENLFEFPLMSFSDKQIKVDYREFIDDDLNREFPYDFNYEDIMYIIKFDKETPKHQIAPLLITSIFQYSQSNKRNFTLEEIIRDSYCNITDFLIIIGSDIFKAVRRKIKEILFEMFKTELSSFLQWDPINQYWIIQKLDIESHINTKVRFQKLGQEYVNRLKEGRDFKDTSINPDQIDLFEDEDL